MMVNIGSFLGPLFTLIARKHSSDLVFYVSAALIACNFILILFYKEPDRIPQSGNLKDALSSVFKNIFTVVKDWKFVLFLSIIAIFWAMYFQLFYTLPVFIGQWVDSSALYHFFSNSTFILEHYSIGNQMDPEFITNFDALFIILFQILVSSVVMRMKPLNSMMTGILINAIGLGLSFMTQNVFFVIFSLFLFGIGEMAASPKVTEYIGRIAPAGKKALYMGFSFIPLFLGSMLAGVLSGPVYQATSDQKIMVINYAQEHGFEISDSLTQNEYFAEVARQSGMETHELVQYFWVQENPSQFWYVVVAIGLFATLCLFLYDRYLLKEKG
jgi:MFS family permease